MVHWIRDAPLGISLRLLASGRIRHRPARTVPRRLSEGDVVADPVRAVRLLTRIQFPVGSRDLVPEIESARTIQAGDSAAPP